jgi:hypothetical protein
MQENKLMGVANFCSLVLGAAALYFPRKYAWKVTWVGMLIGTRVIYLDLFLLDRQMRRHAGQDSSSLLAQEIRNLYTFYYPALAPALAPLSEAYLRQRTDN